MCALDYRGFRPPTLMTGALQRMITRTLCGPVTTSANGCFVEVSENTGNPHDAMTRQKQSFRLVELHTSAFLYRPMLRPIRLHVLGAFKSLTDFDWLI